VFVGNSVGIGPVVDDMINVEGREIIVENLEEARVLTETIWCQNGSLFEPRRLLGGGIEVGGGRTSVNVFTGRTTRRVVSPDALELVELQA